MLMKRTYTNTGKEKGYTEEEIEKSIDNTNWMPFRKENLPFCQGECIKEVIKQCRIPLSKISQMDLHNVINIKPHEHHAFYALDVKYKNGQVQVYIADNGCSACVVASDFTVNN